MMDIHVPNEFVKKLNRTSAKKRFYPFDDDVVDWSVPLTNDFMYMPEEQSFVHGTHVWDRMGPEERSFVTRWEITQMFRNAGSVSTCSTKGF